MHLSWIIGVLIILYLIFLFIAWLMQVLIVWGAVGIPSPSYVATAAVFDALSVITLIVLIIVIGINVILINTVGSKYRERFLETEFNIFPEKKKEICSKTMELKDKSMRKSTPINFY